MKVEKRPITKIYEVEPAVARSSRIIVCPFCESEVRIYIWSFHGGGKKCECGAKLYAWEAKKEVEDYDELGSILDKLK